MAFSRAACTWIQPPALAICVLRKAAYPLLKFVSSPRNIGWSSYYPPATLWHGLNKISTSHSTRYRIFPYSVASGLLKSPRTASSQSGSQRILYRVLPRAWHWHYLPRHPPPPAFFKEQWEILFFSFPLFFPRFQYVWVGFHTSSSSWSVFFPLSLLFNWKVKWIKGVLNQQSWTYSSSILTNWAK